MAKQASRKLTMLALLAATYCMVAGGPYGLEEIVQKAGYAGALIILLVTPVIWSVPTALMVSELSSAIPREGGFYAWVRRGLGPFWGYQEAWLTMTGSIFDMAIYPTLFSWYLARLWPALGVGYIPVLIGTAMIVVCVIWNLFPARTIGRGSIVLTALVLSPFIAIVALGLARPATPGPIFGNLGSLDLLGGIMIAMWNYMGWDNASTVAEEVEKPTRTYPATMFWGVIIVTLTYVIPVAVMARAGLDLSLWSTGGWVDVGQVLGGTALAAVVMLAGAAANMGTFNALVLSLSRLPLVMAKDGFLPKVFAWCHPRTAVPVVSLLACSVTWAACQTLGFLNIVLLDVLISGLSVILEFWALVALRIKEPRLPRPFRVPGGLWGVVGIGILPLALIVLSVVRTAAESIGEVNSLAFAGVVIGLGPIFYLLSSRFNGPARTRRA
jgi:amino acid transporter